MKQLPSSYTQKYYVNLYANRTLSRGIRFVSFLFCAGLLALGWLWRGFDALRAALRAGFAQYALLALALLAALTAFLWLHQLTHGLLLRLLTGESPLFARKGLRLFVGSSAYLRRSACLLVLLLPAPLWTLTAGFACAFLQGRWFWLVFTALLANFGSAADDVYFAIRILCAPKNALFQYRGFAVGIFTEE